MIRIGTAGWSIPAPSRSDFPDAGSQLVRYAAHLSAVEINSSFYRHHRPETYARWAAVVGADFRFAVKLPRAITHERRLVAADGVLERFAGEIAMLGDKLGPVLIQLPPSLPFDFDTAAAFLDCLSPLGWQVVLEPRHASWFSAEVDHLLVAHRIARVAADPSPVPAAAARGGWRDFAYLRYHGAPRIYWSDYAAAALEAHAAAAIACTEEARETWVIYDNTAAGAAIANALSLATLLERQAAS